MEAALLLCGLLTWTGVIVSGEELINITADLGKSTVLPCDAVQYKPLVVVKWTKPDLETSDPNSDKVILYQNGKSGPKVKVKSYKDRVTLMEKETGNVSLVLNNVTTGDSGKYECRVQSRTSRRRRDTYKNIHVSTIYLKVSDPGYRDGGDQDGGDRYGGDQDVGDQDVGDQDVGSRGYLGLVSVPVALIVVSAVIAVVLWKKKKSSPSSPPDEEENPPLV